MTKHNQQLVPLSRIRAEAAGFRVWLEDQSIDTRRLDAALSPLRVPWDALDQDFRDIEGWFSTFWKAYWGIPPDQQRRQPELRNSVIEAQIA